MQYDDLVFDFLETEKLEDEFPFRSSLSFANVLAHLENQKNHIPKDLQKLVALPQLRGEILSLDFFQEHWQDLLKLFSQLLPQSLWESDMVALMCPFQYPPFLMTPRMKAALMKGGSESGVLEFDIISQQFSDIRKRFAYKRILAELYGIQMTIEGQRIVARVKVENQLERYYQSFINGNHTSVTVEGDLPKLPYLDHDVILQNLDDFMQKGNLFDTNAFRFSGVSIMRLFEVTTQHSLSEIKRILLAKNSLMDGSVYKRLQCCLRNLFQRPDVKISIFTQVGDRSVRIGHKKSSSSCMYQITDVLDVASLNESIFRLDRNEAITIYRQHQLSETNSLESEFRTLGVEDLVVIPLFDSRRRRIATLGLLSFTKDRLNLYNIDLITEVIPILEVALERNLDDFQTAIDRVVREQFTAIHPSVNWIFEKAAQKIYANHVETKDPTRERPELVFHNVYPLFAGSDIRNSSQLRNEAIVSDLLEQLEIATRTIDQASSVLRIPLLLQMRSRCIELADRIQTHLSVGDESEVLHFLQNTFEPSMALLSERDETIKNSYQNYCNQLHPNHRIVSKRRSAYEESVLRINQACVNHLEVSQGEAQAIFPHYFERQLTDGIDHSIYIGASLAQGHDFNAFYLKNLRLWQLRLICHFDAINRQLKSDLPIPLDLAHIIVVQHNTMSIRFDYDEKRFEVDGTYNIRYEIMKKRIDKARIKGTNERLTQPHQVAIVFSSDDEMQEYKEYIQYLAQESLLGTDIEYVTLEDLQGVQGLRAMRVPIRLDLSMPSKKAS